MTQRMIQELVMVGDGLLCLSGTILHWQTLMHSLFSSVLIDFYQIFIFLHLFLYVCVCVCVHLYIIMMMMTMMMITFQLML